MMSVHPSGFYAWCETPQSPRALEDGRLLGHIKHSWLESGSVYGYRKVLDNLRDLGETCGKHRVYRLMKQEELRSQTGYRRRPGARGGPIAVLAPNHLQRQFDVTEPNRVWVTDITYIRTHEGWLFLAAVLDLFSRQVIGWSMGPRMDRELTLNALLMAVWRRQPKQTVMVHSDQESQFSSYDWQAFLKAHNLQQSIADAATVMTMRSLKAFSNCSSGNGFDERLIKRERRHGRMCSITSRCSTPRRKSPWGITQNGVTATMIGFRR
jgi:putative transposase